MLKNRLMESDEYEEFDIPTVNRAALLITPKQPYADWANQLPDRSEGEIAQLHTPESMSDEPAVYLIPEPPAHDNYKYVNKNWAELFEMQLEGWYLDPDAWPTNRTKKMFDEWFDIKVSSLVLDLGDGPIERDDN